MYEIEGSAMTFAIAETFRLSPAVWPHSWICRNEIVGWCQRSPFEWQMTEGALMLARYLVFSEWRVKC